MTDIKNTLLVIGGTVVLVVAAIFGLTKMSGTATSASTVDPQVLLDGARFVKENGETKVTVVTFADIQCPSCKMAKNALKELESMAGVKYVVRHFPLPANVHKYSVISARAVEAGRVMGKGWELMDLMFDKQTEWSEVSKPEDKFAEYAKTLGLDEKQFVEKLNSKEVEELVQVDTILANKLKLSGTPTIFVNGEQVGVPFVIDKVKELLKK